jgi:hypothetical protein
MKAILATIIILLTVPLYAQSGTLGQREFLGIGVIEALRQQNHSRQEQIERNNRYYAPQNETIIDNRGRDTIIYQRHGNVTTGSDGTICIRTGSTTVCN